MTEVLQGTLVMLQAFMHGAALITGFMVLQKYQGQLQTVKVGHTFNPKAVRASYLSRRVWVLGITIPFSLIMLLYVLTGQVGPNVADLIGALITAIYHVDALKDKRNKAHA